MRRLCPYPIAFPLLFALCSCASAERPRGGEHAEGDRALGSSARHSKEGRGRDRTSGRQSRGGTGQRTAVPATVWIQPCEEDVARLCAEEQAGEGSSSAAAEGCLRSHLGELSLDCRSALLGPPPPPARGSAGAHRRRIMEVCREEAEVFCPDAGSRREVIACLSSQSEALEARCRAALDDSDRALAESGDEPGRRRGKGGGKMGGTGRGKMGGTGQGGMGGMGRGF